MSLSGHARKRRIKTTWDAVLALYQLLDDVLTPSFGLGQIFQDAATRLTESKSDATTFTSDAVIAQQEADQQLLLLYNMLLDRLFQRQPLADTTPNREYATTTLTQARAAMLDAFPETSSDTIDTFLKMFIEQPDSLTAQWKNAQLTPLEMRITRAFIDYLRPQKTPVEQYNCLVAALIDPHRTPLEDTASNAEYAAKVLAAIQSSTTLELTSRAIEPKHLDSFLATVFSDQNTASLPQADTIRELLKTGLEPALHTSLTLFNILQWHFNYPALPDTVENDERAKTALRQILMTLSENIGQEKASAFLENIITLTEHDIPQATGEDKALVEQVNEQLLMTLYPNYRAAERPELYPRIIADLARLDTRTTLAEKISLLTQLGTMIADRPQYIIVERTADPLMKAFDTMGNDAETLAVTLIKALYAMRFGEEEPELKVTPEPVADEVTSVPPPSPKRETPPPLLAQEAGDNRENTKTRRAPSPITPPEDDERKPLPKDPAAERRRLAAAREQQRQADEEKRRHDIALQEQHILMDAAKRHEQQIHDEAEEQKRLQQIGRSHELDLIAALRNPHTDIDLFKRRQIDSDLTDLNTDDEKSAAPSSKQALHDHLFTYVSAQIAPDNARKQSLRWLITTHTKSYQTLIQTLLQLIQKTASATETMQFARENAELANAYAQLSDTHARHTSSETDDLRAFSQAEIIRTRLLHAFEADKRLPKPITALVTHLKQATATTKLIDDLAALCKLLSQSATAEERESANEILATLKSSSNQIDRNHHVLLLATNLAMLINPPKEQAAKTFLQTLAKLYAKQDSTDETLLAAFKTFLTEDKSPGIERILANAREQMQSPRLNQMKHIALLFLDNLESFYIAAEGKSHTQQAAFAACRKSLWELSTRASEANSQENVLINLLNTFLKTVNRDITIQADDKGLLQQTASSAESERLQLLALLTDYAQALTNLKKQLRPDLDRELIPVKEAIRAFLQFTLQVNAAGIANVRTTITKAAAGYEESIALIMKTNQQPAPTSKAPSTATIARSLGQLNVLTETRNKEKALANRQKALAAIFKPSTPGKK